jgi:hypothetical protein
MYRRLVQPLIGGYNPALEGSEDYDYWIRLHNFFKIKHIGRDQPLYFYRVHRQSMSARLKPRISQQRRWLMKREQQFQQLLYQPVTVIIDDRSAQLLGNIQTTNRALPALNFTALADTPSASQISAKAMLLHIANLNDDLVARCKASNYLLICWTSTETSISSPLKQALTQTDLLIAPEHSLPKFDNVVFTSKPEDIYHLTRIFVGARLV